MSEQNELMRLIRRGQKSSVESRRLLLSSSELMYERLRLRHTGITLFRDILDLADEFTSQIDQKHHRAESRS